MNFFFFFQVAKKRKSVEPCSPVEKKARPATKVSKKASTPKSKNIKKTVKQVKSPVKTPVKSPVPTGSKVVTPKVPGRQKTLSKPQTPKLTLAARKRSRSRSPADALSSKKNDAGTYNSKYSENDDKSPNKSSCIIS